MRSGLPRRSWLGLLGAACAAVWVQSLAQGPIARIGVLASASGLPQVPAPIQALREGLRALGYVEGRTLEIEYRWADGNAARLPELAAELVRSRVALIVATGDAPIRAAMAATRSIPIVMATSGDAVGAGFVASLARPGGNVTGMTAINPELAAKRLQLLLEILPRARRIGALYQSDDPVHRLDLRAAQAAAAQLGLSLLPVGLQAPQDIDRAFDELLRTPLDALLVFNDTTTVQVRERILQLCAQHRLGSMFEAREWAAAGGLLAYGVAHVDLFRQSAQHVHRILQGARAADLPVQQPTRVRLAINLKTARALGITIAQPLLLRADELIE